MKKIITVTIIIAMLVLMMTGCGNMSMGFGNFTFKKIHVDTYHYSGCLTIEEWCDTATGIEVKTEEAGSMFLSEGTYILVEGDEGCPFCGE